MSHGGDADAGKRELVTVTQPVRRMRVNRGEAAIVTTDDKGRMEFQPLDLDLARQALDEHYKRRVQ